MPDSKFVQVLKRLLQFTHEAKVSWGETASEDAFRIALGNGLIRVRQASTPDGDVGYEAVLLDRTGRELDRAWAIGPNHPDLEWLADLYYVARSSALNAEKVLDSMLADLEEGITRPLPPLSAIDD